jgi:UDP-glucuronate decarboxylase
MRRVLVLGGAGLVGSHLIDRLLAGGDEVTAIDDLSRGTFANVAHLKRHARFAFHEQDIAVPFHAEVDRIYHLALPSTRAACGEDPVKAAITCVSGTLNALEVAAANDARLVLGTASERWGAGIRCAESIAIDFAGARHTAVSIVRIPSTYGPRLALDGAHLVTTLVLQALRGERLAPPGRLERRVHVTYVDDAVETLVRAMEVERRVPAVLAPSSELTVLELAQQIAAAAGLAEVETSAAVLDGPPSTAWGTGLSLADAVPARLAFGMSARVDLTEGLARTLRWFEERTGRRAAGRPSGVYTCDSPAQPPALGAPPAPPSPAPAREKLRAG